MPGLSHRWIPGKINSYSSSYWDSTEGATRPPMTPRERSVASATPPLRPPPSTSSSLLVLPAPPPPPSSLTAPTSTSTPQPLTLVSPSSSPDPTPIPTSPPLAEAAPPLEGEHRMQVSRDERERAFALVAFVRRSCQTFVISVRSGGVL